MKKLRSVSIVLVMLLTAAAFTACGSVKDALSQEYKADVEVIDSYYSLDKDSGKFTVAVIVKNSGDKTYESVDVDSRGFDSDGNVISEKEFVTEDGEHMGRMLSGEVYGLGPGETKAFVLNTSVKPGTDNEGNKEDNILDFFEDVPERIEWQCAPQEVNADKHIGLVVEECTYDGEEFFDENTLSKYKVKISNPTETDYKFIFDGDEYDQCFETEYGFCDTGLTLILRDSEGAIIGAAPLEILADSESEYDIPAGGETEIEYYTHAGDLPEDAEAEAYISMMYYQP